MRSLLFSLCLLPLFAEAQVNRSAREFATEQVQEYVTKKLFKDQNYRSLGFGELKAVPANNAGLTWVIDHEFQVSREEKPGPEGRAPAKVYKFTFYLDEKMHVLRSETFYSN